MKFVMAINCMDGRTQLPIIEWLKKEYGATYVDMITEPGPNKIPAENKDQIITAVKNAESWEYDVQTSGLWVDENWQVYKVK
jgi:hypothetical protein